jgi:hypothetical protein
MKRIDDQTREAISELAEELEADGWMVNRRAMAREFGVSPQTVARILDGPDARRSIASAKTTGQRGRPALVVGAVIAVAAIILWRGRR